MAIIGVFGYSGVGKDVVGSLIQYTLSKRYNMPFKDVVAYPTRHEWWLEEGSGWEIKKWAGKLKAVASILTGIPQEKFEDQEFKKTNLESHWGMTVRDLLQKLGTDAMRNGLHPNSWVNALMADYVPTKVQWAQGPIGGYEDGPMPGWIITDTRFQNEAKAIKDMGGIVIKVERPGVGPINDHSSEIALKDYDFDYTINNDGSLEDLLTQVKKFIESSVFTSL